MNRKTKNEVIDQSLQLTQKNNLTLKLPDIPEEINSIRLHSLLIEKIKKFEEYRLIPKLHTDTINKIVYVNRNKYITCSKDKTIIIRNLEDNKIKDTFVGHTESVCDIILLTDNRLASCSQDNKIKIWYINGFCEETLIGHSDTVYCLLEMQNSILLSGSQDSSIGIWNISHGVPKSQFYKNDKQKQAYCMTLIDSNKLAASSKNDINIYSFENKSLNIIKTLKGHANWVYDIKLMKHSKDLLVSCSGDKDCRLWSILHGNCLKIFKGHTDTIWSIQILSQKIFVSAGVEIIFWDIESPEIIRSMKPDESEDRIASMIKNKENELVFAGGHDFIGLIKI